jgi:hypothetical protein
MEEPLSLVEVWEELQSQVKHLAGLAGLKIIRGVIKEEVTRRIWPRYQPALLFAIASRTISRRRTPCSKNDRQQKLEQAHTLNSQQERF